MIAISALFDNAPSLAVSCSTYAPATENVAVVLRLAAFPNVTEPGPLTLDQLVVSTALGKPSSLADPLRVADAGNVMV